MHSTYPVKLVSQQDEMDFVDRNPPRGGFGLPKDDIIYKTVTSALEQEAEEDELLEEVFEGD